jgi:hypothetical protein
MGLWHDSQREVPRPPYGSVYHGLVYGDFLGLYHAWVPVCRFSSLGVLLNGALPILGL